MRLTINTILPRLHIHYFWPRMQIQQELPQVQIETYGPELEIDQEQAWAELGIGNNTYLGQQIRERAYERVLQGIQEMAQEGDRIMNSVGLFQEDLILPDIVKERMDREIPELNVDVVPKTKPKIRFDYGHDIQWRIGGVITECELRPPMITLEKGEVQILVE